jgi:MFS family permease
LLIVGLLFSVVITIFLVVPMLRAAYAYVETDCVVLEKKLEESQDDEGGITYRPAIRIRYTVANRDHDIWTYDTVRAYGNIRGWSQAILDRFQVGGHYPCWYDPDDPGKAVLTRELSWFLLFALIPLIFVILGAGGLIYNWRHRPTPAEKDAARTAQAVLSVSTASVAPALRGGCVVLGGFLAAGVLSMALLGWLFAAGAPFWAIPIGFFAPFVVFIIVVSAFGKRLVAAIQRASPSPEQQAALQARKSTGPDDEADYPTVPQLDLSDRPGTTLRYQLPTSTSSGCQLLGALGITLFWNGIVSVFLWQAIFGDGGWFLRIFLIPFVLVGLALILFTLVAFLQLISALLLGRVSLELAEHPLSPGAQVELLFEQAGIVRLGRVRLTLTCTESATFQQGTTTRTEKHEVSSTLIVDPETSDFTGQLTTTLAVPAEAMHSFEAANNKILWQLNLSGRVLGLLPYSSEFPLVVRPE